jgi:hypothetical protein
MSRYATPLLGRYAVLQNSLFNNKAEGSRFQQQEQDLFRRFTREPLPQQVEAQAIEPPCATERLIEVTVGAHEAFYEAKTVFPFALFPDTMSIDRQKLTITHRNFFKSSVTASVQIKDIMNVQANVGPYFGSLILTSKHFLNNTQTIDHLKRGDIIKAQHLLQGFMIAHRSKIDTDTIDKEQLISLLNDLGQGNTN